MPTMFTETFFPAPGSGMPGLSVRFFDAPFGNTALVEQVADVAGRHFEDIKLAELSWDNGDLWADFLLLDGKIIGAHGIHAEDITFADWLEILELHQPSANAA